VFRVAPRVRLDLGITEAFLEIDHVKLSALRQEFHRFPELGFKEEQTKAKVATRLRELDLEVHEGAGVVGVLRAGTGNRAIGLRADMDALPIMEKSHHDYQSQTPGVMHACGHDGHMTMLLGAAQALAADPRFDGTVVFLFQPNEEHGLGAQAMIDEGVLEQFPIEEVYAIHNLPGAPVGQVSTRPGLICSSESLFEITIKGQGGHASMPQTGRDAITIGAEIVQALQTIIARKLAPGAGAVISVTEFLTDGQRNVLPGTATLKGDARARTPEDRNDIERFMRQIAEGIAAAHGVSVDVGFNTEFIETINAEGPTNAVIRAANAAGLDTVPDRQPMSFSEDFAHFSAAVPGCFLLLGNGETKAHGQPLHSSDYDFNDDLLPIGATFWTKLVRDRLPLREGKVR
jgi:amidohydrolase